MKKIIYVISKIITFPGTFMKGFLEHIFCRIFKVNIYAADKYVTSNALSGHVSMLPSESAYKSFAVCFFPGLFNFAIGFCCYAVSVLSLGYLGIELLDYFSGLRNPMFFVYCFMLYFGVSLMCNLFPYREDASHMWKMLYGKESKSNIVAKIILFIPSVIMVAGAWLEKYGLTLLINIALAVYIFVF